MRHIDMRRIGLVLAIAVPSLGVATAAAWILETYLDVPDASVVYLVAVVVTAVAAGTVGAIATAVASFLVYNFFFTQPLHTFAIEDPGDWLGVILLLFVGIVVGQLAARQRARAETALARERESRALFGVSRELAVRESTPAVLPTITRILRDETAMARVWISLGADEASERVAADSDEEGSPPPMAARYQVLRRTPGEGSARWSRVHQSMPRTSAQDGRGTYRIRIVAGDAAVGSIWALRRRERGEPERAESRLLAVAADQLGGALAHDRLAAESQAAEIARQSDALKSALLQSVSHDLRTPLATIRAAAGSLRPGSGLSPEDRQESVDAIDREVEYLDRLVTNLLDLSRIEAGALRAQRDVLEVDDLVGRVLERLQGRLAGRPLRVALDAPLVEVDPVFLDEALTNVMENAVKHTPEGTPLWLSASAAQDGAYVLLSVEDGGRGVPPEALPRLFERFYRVPGRGRGSRAGTGIGLAVARGLVEASGGHVEARTSERGGLAIDLYLPVGASGRADIPLGVG
jgi:two-component system, OmpR family, sensor histidine kinase KdpD